MPVNSEIALSAPIGQMRGFSITVAILAQGTSWAVAVTQASFAEVRKRAFAHGMHITAVDELGRVFLCVCVRLRGLAVFVTYLLVCALALLASPALLLEIAVWARDW